MNFSNTFVSVLFVSISVASATIAHENCTSDTMYFLLSLFAHTFPFSVFLTHILQHTAQEFIL